MIFLTIFAALAGVLLIFDSIREFRSQKYKDSAMTWYTYHRYTWPVRQLATALILLIFVVSFTYAPKDRFDYWAAYLSLSLGIITLAAAWLSIFSNSFNQWFWALTWQRDLADRKRFTRSLLILSSLLFFFFYVFYRPFSGIPG